MSTSKRSLEKQLAECQAALEASETRFRNVIEHNADGILIVDHHGIVRFVNAAAERLLTRKKKNLIGEPFGFPLVAGDTTELDIFRCTGPLETHTENPDKMEGTEHDRIVAEMRVVESAWDGEPVYLATLRDITAHKNIESALREALHESRRHQAEIEALLTGARAVLKHRDLQKAAKTILNTCQTVIGATAGCITLHPDPEAAEQPDQPQFLALSGGLADKSLCKARVIYRLSEQATQMGHATYDNNPTDAENSDLNNGMCVPLLIEGGKIGVICLTNKPGGFDDRDVRITSAFSNLAAIAILNSRTLNSLKASEHKFRTLFNSAGDAIFIHDMEGHFLEVNEAACQRLGYSREELLQMSPQDIGLPEHAEQFSERTEALQKDGRACFESAHVHQDGHVISVEINSRLIEYQGQLAVLSIARDITERIRAAKERQQAEASLAWQASIDASIAALSQALISPTSIEEISALVLKHAQRLTHSTFGFVGYIDPHNDHLICPTMTKNIWETCQIDGKGHKKAVFSEWGGLWGWVLEHRQSLLANDLADDPRSSGVPEGHIPIENFLSAPALLEEELVGQIALANSEPGYRERDLKLVERLAQLYAIAIRRQRTEQQLKNTLGEKEVLLKEIHHRIKNNMQSLIYLIDMQADTIDDPEVLHALDDLQGRVRAMALIHSQLYQSQDLARVDFGAYLEELATYLIHASQRGLDVQLIVEAEESPIDVNAAIPCGLMVNELLTNALKHAFPPGSNGECRVKVSFKAQDDKYTLTINDNGVGLPANLDWQSTDSLGLKLVKIWATYQLGGDIEVDTTHGTTFAITFPKEGE